MKSKHDVAVILLLGVLLFAGDPLWRPAAGPASAGDRYRIEVTEPMVRALEAGFAQRYGTTPSPAQRQALLAEYVDREILVREARAYAFDVRDASVRRRLLQKMRAVGADPELGEDELIRRARALGFDDDLVIRRLLAEEMRLVLRRGPGREPPTDAEVRRWLESHGKRFNQPVRVTLRHCFRRLEGSGERTAVELRAALDALPDLKRADPPIDCDALPLASRLRAQSHPRLAGRFGEPFADRVFGLPPGRWSGPVESTFGLHLVYVEERLEARPPSLGAVRSRVLHELLAREGDRRLAERMAQLRASYTVSLSEVRS